MAVTRLHLQALHWLLLPALTVVICCFPSVSSDAGQLKQTRRVLIINDLGIVSSPGFAEVDGAIFDTLKKSPYQIELYHESLQLTFFPDETSESQFRDSLIRKYSERKPDLIIAAGSAALPFIAESQESFLRETPIIFCGVLGDLPDQLKRGLHITGVLGRVQPEATLKLALRLLPGTKHVVVVGGVGKFDELWERAAKQAFQSYESRLEFVYLTNLTMPVLLERLGNLPSNTIVYHTSIAQDAAGQRFIGSAESVPLVASAANAPVFVMDDVDLKAGALGKAVMGGALVNWLDDGRVAGEMALRVLNGERPEDIPIETSKNAYMFDWRALKRWGIKERDLPAGSIVLNRQPTFWQAYKTYVIAALLVLLLQSAAIFALLWQRAWRRKTQVALRNSEEKFSKAFQRSPLAFTLTSLVDSRFMEVNETFEHYTGWERGEVVGRTPMDLKFWADLDQRSAFLEQLRGEGTVRNMDVLFQKKDGQVRAGLISSERIHLDGGPCALTLLADVTDAKQAEEARRESEERFRLVANTAPVMIWMAGTDKLCSYFNKPWLDFTGRALELELGNGWAEGVHGDDIARCLKVYTEGFDKRETFEMEYRLRRHDGEYRWVLDIGAPRFNSDGSFAGYIGSCIDITERKVAVEALATVGRRLIEAHEEERAWIARELHDDINQRLALLAIELEQWGQRHASATAVVECFGRAKQRITDISADVQSLSHRLHSSKLDYLGLATAANSFCREFAEKQKVEVMFSNAGIPSNLPKEVSLSLFRVMQEALQNAIKYSGVRSFSVDLRGTQDFIQLRVSDNGRGFEKEQVFTDGGLGLISMRERIQMVGGEFEIKSEIGAGTTIHARVPLKAQEYRAMAG